MRKSKYLGQKKEVGHIIKRLEKCGLEVKIKEVPVAMDEPDIAFQILSREKYATSLSDIFSLEQLAIILEAMQ
jgi:nucleoside diphosphate kinase